MSPSSWDMKPVHQKAHSSCISRSIYHTLNKLRLTVCHVGAYRYFQLGIQMFETLVSGVNVSCRPVSLSVFRSQTSSCRVQKAKRCWTPRSPNCRTRVRSRLPRVQTPAPMLAEQSAWSVRCVDALHIKALSICRSIFFLLKSCFYPSLKKQFVSFISSIFILSKNVNQPVAVVTSGDSHSTDWRTCVWKTHRNTQRADFFFLSKSKLQRT